MARVTKEQAEIEGTESPARNDELHALGLEIKDLESRRKEATSEESDKRHQAVGILHALGIDRYHVDRILIELKAGKEKVKVHLDSDDGGEG